MNTKVCIIGLGLIGGSLGMAIRQKGLAKVIGLTRDSSKIGTALGKEAIDFGTVDPREAVKDADIIFICYPIHLIIPELKKIMKFAKPGAIITDVGSTKEEIVSKAEKLIPQHVFFIGGHPMAGKEQTGLCEAETELFKGRNYILTRTKQTNSMKLTELQEFLQELGTNVIILDPKTHDQAVAGISHALIAVTAAVVNTVGNSGKFKKLMTELAASGFRDTTRIASGDPMLAMGMFETNRKSVLDSLKKIKTSINKMENFLKKGNFPAIKKELIKAKKLRDSLYS